MSAPLEEESANRTVTIRGEARRRFKARVEGRGREMEGAREGEERSGGGEGVQGLHKPYREPLGSPARSQIGKSITGLAGACCF